MAGNWFCVQKKRLLDTELLKEEMNKRGVTKMWFTSSWFNQLVETDITVFKGLATILVGGEKVSEQHLEKLMQTMLMWISSMAMGLQRIRPSP